ncbi:integrating conjugative element protein, PFL_4704 family [Yersinia pseudotuberculosis]|uniref:Integrating conjugative element protein, PFL_4704 family n=1 Tax=Yersinia pseudotuberculosis TaxID=633 RepID=A0A380Q3V9_YERPU|nr:integrating conjugative element protein, PFL_4704 family [Yersinia pseudotuberculosis]
MNLMHHHYLPRYLILLGMVGVLGVSLPANATELMKWERIPLQIPLNVDQERIIFVDKNVRVGFPPELNGKLRVQSSGGAVYLRPNTAFSSTRLQLQNIKNGELILLDISATASKRRLEPVKLVYQGEVYSATTSDNTTVNENDGKGTEPKITLPLPMALTRYAAQNLYAPLRTLEPLPGVYAISNALPSTITTLLPSEPVTVRPLAAWGVPGYNLVALKISNQQIGKVVLDPRHLRGTFYSATFQHRWLGAAGTPEDTTMLYLVMKGRPDTAFLPEPVAPARNGKVKTKAGARINAN